MPIDHNIESYIETNKVFQKNLTDSLKAASDLIDSGRHQEANIELNDLLASVDNFYANWEDRFRDLEPRTEDQTACLESISKVFDINKCTVLETLAYSYHTMGKFRAAESELLRAQTYVDTFAHDEFNTLTAANIQWKLGRTSWSLGKFREALEAYVEAFHRFEDLGRWESAINVVAEAADCSYLGGERGEYADILNVGIKLANEHGLPAMADRLFLKQLQNRLYTDTTGNALLELKAMLKDKQKRDALSNDSSLLYEIDLLQADISAEYGDLDSAKEALQRALEAARKDAKLDEWLVLDKCADLRDLEGQTWDAIELAGRAFDIAQHPVSKQIVLNTLIKLRFKTKDARQRAQAMKEIQMLRELEDPQKLAEALMSRVIMYLDDRDFQLAFQDIKEVQDIVVAPEIYIQSSKAEIIALLGLKKKQEAYEANRRAIEYIKEKIVPEGEFLLTKWRLMLKDYVWLLENAATLSARLGYVQEAFDLAEASKARTLNTQLAYADLVRLRNKNSADTFEAQRLALLNLSPNATNLPRSVALNELRSWLASESAGMAMFCVGANESLAIVIDPSEPEPNCSFIKINDDDLKSALSVGDEEGGTRPWNELIFQPTAKLSNELLGPLDSISKHCKVLYLVLDSRLYSIPFAALKFKDGTSLIDRCATAYVPSATVLKTCRDRRKDRPKKSCVALAVGATFNKVICDIASEIAQGLNVQWMPGDDAIGIISFTEETRAAVCEYPWAAIKWLLDGDATFDNYKIEAPHADVLHLSCHGIVEKNAAINTLSASCLELANKARVTAEDIFSLTTPLDAELVFLNSCVSGRFRLLDETGTAGGEVGGFWQAFLFAGAGSLITTLSFVDPESAHELAREFYRAWSTGCSKAEALRRAQLQMRERYGDAQHWASHILVGDHY